MKQTNAIWHGMASLLTSAALVFPLLALAAEPTATIKINLAQEKAPVSPTLYGIFMEEISQGFDGGIYAELVRNRSFEEGVLPPGMKLITNQNGSLRMEIAQLPAGVPTNKWDIRSDKPTDENSLDNPRRIQPQALPLPNCARNFPVTLPPYSVNVLLVPAGRN